MLQNNAQRNNNINSTDVNENPQATGRNHYNIDKKDIVEAQFEEIKPDEEDKKDKPDKSDKE